MSYKENINPVIKIVFIITFSLIFLTNCNSQQGKGINQHKENFKNFCIELKQSNIVYAPDTTKIGLGVYEPFAEKYFDKATMLDIMQVDTSYLTVNAKFFLVQQFTAVLQNHLKKIPEENLKVIDYTNSKSLYKDWAKISNKEEVTEIKNSLMLLYKNEEREIELMLINFSDKTNKIIFLTSMGMSIEDSKFIESLMLKK